MTIQEKNPSQYCWVEKNQRWHLSIMLITRWQWVFYISHLFPYCFLPYIEFYHHSSHFIMFFSHISRFSFHFSNSRKTVYHPTIRMDSLWFIHLRIVIHLWLLREYCKLSGHQKISPKKLSFLLVTKLI